VVVLGANGAGKTTLPVPATGAPDAAPRSSRLRLREERRAVRREIGLVAHSSHVYEDLTAAENLTFSHAAFDHRRPTSPPRRGRRAERALAARLHVLRGHEAPALVARFVPARPRVLLLDERHGLDQRGKKWLEEHLASFKAGGGRSS
jgi:ABC-2 type transport system ATP-binding protein/heme exporter protein A